MDLLLSSPPFVSPCTFWTGGVTQKLPAEPKPQHWCINRNRLPPLRVYLVFTLAMVIRCYLHLLLLSSMTRPVRFVCDLNSGNWVYIWVTGMCKHIYSVFRVLLCKNFSKQNCSAGSFAHSDMLKIWSHFGHIYYLLVKSWVLLPLWTYISALLTYIFNRGVE